MRETKTKIKRVHKKKIIVVTKFSNSLCGNKLKREREESIATLRN